MNLESLDIEHILEKTKCKKPCFYKKYKLIGDKQTSSFTSDYFFLGLWSASNNTFVETEVLIYPWTSLVAEFGGTLGLFLGFSFVTLWNGMERLLMWARQFLQKKPKDSLLSLSPKCGSCRGV